MLGFMGFLTGNHTDAQSRTSHRHTAFMRGILGRLGTNIHGLWLRDFERDLGMTARTVQSGRSLVETLAVLAIMGVLSIGGLWGYDTAVQMWKEAETYDQAGKTIMGAKTGMLDHQYNALVSARYEETRQYTPHIIDIRLIISGVSYNGGGETTGLTQTQLREVSSFTTPTNVPVWARMEAPFAFTVRMSGLSRDVCETMVGMDTGYLYAWVNGAGVDPEGSDLDKSNPYEELMASKERRSALCDVFPDERYFPVQAEEALTMTVQEKINAFPTLVLYYLEQGGTKGNIDNTTLLECVTDVQCDDCHYCAENECVLKTPEEAPSCYEEGKVTTACKNNGDCDPCYACGETGYCDTKLSRLEAPVGCYSKTDLCDGITCAICSDCNAESGDCEKKTESDWVAEELEICPPKDKVDNLCGDVICDPCYKCSIDDERVFCVLKEESEWNEEEQIICPTKMDGVVDLCANVTCDPCYTCNSETGACEEKPESEWTEEEHIVCGKVCTPTDSSNCNSICEDCINNRCVKRAKEEVPDDYWSICFPDEDTDCIAGTGLNADGELTAQCCQELSGFSWYDGVCCRAGKTTGLVKNETGKVEEKALETCCSVLMEGASLVSENGACCLSGQSAETGNVSEECCSALNGGYFINNRCCQMEGSVKTPYIHESLNMSDMGWYGGMPELYCCEEGAGGEYKSGTCCKNGYKWNPSTNDFSAYDLACSDDIDSVTYCKANPYDPSCYCLIYPDAQGCGIPYCVRYPDDIKCVDWCVLYPDTEECICQYYPERVTQAHYCYCRIYPEDSFCVSDGDEEEEDIRCMYGECCTGGYQNIVDKNTGQLVPWTGSMFKEEIAQAGYACCNEEYKDQISGRQEYYCCVYQDLSGRPSTIPSESNSWSNFCCQGTTLTFTGEVDERCCSSKHMAFGLTEYKLIDGENCCKATHEDAYGFEPNGSNSETEIEACCTQYSEYTWGGSKCCRGVYPVGHGNTDWGDNEKEPIKECCEIQGYKWGGSKCCQDLYAFGTMGELEETPTEDCCKAQGSGFKWDSSNEQCCQGTYIFGTDGQKESEPEQKCCELQGKKWGETQCCDKLYSWEEEGSTGGTALEECCKAQGSEFKWDSSNEQCCQGAYTWDTDGKKGDTAVEECCTAQGKTWHTSKCCEGAYSWEEENKLSDQPAEECCTGEGYTWVSGQSKCCSGAQVFGQDKKLSDVSDSACCEAQGGVYDSSKNQCCVGSYELTSEKSTSASKECCEASCNKIKESDTGATCEWVESTDSKSGEGYCHYCPSEGGTSSGSSSYSPPTQGSAPGKKSE